MTQTAGTILDLLGGLPEEIQQQVQNLEKEISTLQGEVSLLRRRDEVLNSYMEKLGEELRLASRLQRDFLPKSLPEIGRVRFHTLFKPAHYVSGDLYDVMRLDEKHIG